MIKMRLKRILVSLICISVLLANINAYAVGVAQTPETAIPESAVCEDGGFYDGVLTVNSGKAVMKIEFPFISQGVKIKYNAAQDTDVKMYFEPSRKEISFRLDSKLNQKEVNFPIALTAEMQTITIECSGPVTFLEWNMIPDAKEHDYGERNSPTQIAYTSYEEMLQTATIVSVNSPIALVRNAKRYLCTDHLDFTPVVIDGITYIPTEIVREMLRECVEEDRENKTIAVKNEDSITMVFDENGCTISDIFSEKREYAPMKIFGEHYCLPLRFVSEAFGKAVEYRDGVIIVDEKNRINAILNDVDLINYAKEAIVAVKTVGRVLHVAQKNPNANDTNSGTEDMPYKTINAAAAVAKAGDTILVHEGDYRETVEFKNDGLQGSPITLKGAEGEEVILNASEVVGKLRPYKGDIYITNVPNTMDWNKKQIWINRQPYAEGRYPNEDNHPTVPNIKEKLGLNPYWATIGDMKGLGSNEEYGKNYITSDTLLDQEEPDYWKGAVINLFQGHGWSRSQAVITSSGKGWVRHSLDEGSPHGLSFGWLGYTAPLDGDNGFITGSLNTVDIPGEWYMDDEFLYIIPPEGFDFDNDVIEYKARTLLIDLRKKSHIKVQNIHGFGGSISMLDAQMCIIDDCNFEYTSHSIWCADQRTGYIDNFNDRTENEDHANGGAGIYISGADNVFKNSRIYSSAISGLYLAGRTTYVYNNLLEQTSYLGTTTGGIYIGFEEWKPKNQWRGGYAIYYNTVWGNSRGSLITSNFYEAWVHEIQGTRFAAMDIAYNDFYAGGVYSGRDGGLFYGHGTQMGDNIIRTKMHKNLFWDYYVYDGYEGAMYYDAGVTEMDGFCNVAFCTDEVGNYKLTSYNEDKNGQTMHKVNTCDWNYGVTMYIPEGKEGLTVDDYPNKFVFQSGSTLSEIGRITPKPETTKTYYFAEDIELTGEWEKQENGAMRPSSTSDFAVIKNVDMTGLDSFEIAFTGNYYDKKDNISIYADSFDGENIAVKSFKSKAPKMYQIDTETVKFTPIEGVHDLYIKLGEVNSVSYLSITPKPYKVMQNENESGNATVICCEDFVDYGTWGSGWKKRELPPEAKSIGLKGSWGGYWVNFENAYLYDNYSHVSITFGTEGQWDGGVVRVYIDSRDNPPATEFKLDGAGWGVFVTEAIALPDRVSTTGLHQVFLEFDGDGCCADIYDVTFFHTTEDVPARVVNTEYNRTQG